MQQSRGYSIVSSVVASSVAGTSRPSAFAVLRLITSSYLVGCWTGSSATFAPHERLQPCRVRKIARRATNRHGVRGDFAHAVACRGRSLVKMAAKRMCYEIGFSLSIQKHFLLGSKSLFLLPRNNLIQSSPLP